MTENPTIHFFDIDDTLLNINNKVWIIDKERSDEPIIKIDKHEMRKIINGFYRINGVKITYCGDSYYLPESLIEKINKKRKLKPERLGFSYIEFFDKEYINSRDTELLLNNIKHIKPNDKICILADYSNKKDYEKILNTLRLYIKEKTGNNIWKIFFVSDNYRTKNSLNSDINMINILSEHALGLKIRDNSFVSVREDFSNNIQYYSSDFKNIDTVSFINAYISEIIRNTDDETLNYVYERLRNNKITVTSNLVTNNQENRFKTTQYTIKEPENYLAYLKKFKNFNAKS